MSRSTTWRGPAGPGPDRSDGDAPCSSTRAETGRPPVPGYCLAVADGDRQSGPAELRDGPLTGIIVVDMTVAIQGPHASSYLSDMGADVIKIERPGGELNRYVRGPGFAPPHDVMGTQYVAMNRGKRGMVLDAHSDLGREVVQRLIARADVFVTNYRRQALEGMGLGHERVAAANPRLVYARVSG